MLDRVEAAWFVPDEVEVLGAMIMIITHLLYSSLRITHTLDRVLTSCYVLPNHAVHERPRKLHFASRKHVTYALIEQRVRVVVGR
jgi:hypothetical protein